MLHSQEANGASSVSIFLKSGLTLASLTFNRVLTHEASFNNLLRSIQELDYTYHRGEPDSSKDEGVSVNMSPGVPLDISPRQRAEQIRLFGSIGITRSPNQSGLRRASRRIDCSLGTSSAHCGCQHQPKNLDLSAAEISRKDRPCNNDPKLLLWPPNLQQC